jgi:hypothetical protein
MPQLFYRLEGALQGTDVYASVGIETFDNKKRRVLLKWWLLEPQLLMATAEQTSNINYVTNVGSSTIRQVSNCTNRYKKLRW